MLPSITSFFAFVGRFDCANPGEWHIINRRALRVVTVGQLQSLRSDSRESVGLLGGFGIRRVPGRQEDSSWAIFKNSEWFQGKTVSYV